MHTLLALAPVHATPRASCLPAVARSRSLSPAPAAPPLPPATTCMDGGCGCRRACWAAASAMSWGVSAVPAPPAARLMACGMGGPCGAGRQLRQGSVRQGRAAGGRKGKQGARGQADGQQPEAAKADARQPRKRASPGRTSASARMSEAALYVRSSRQSTTRESYCLMPCRQGEAGRPGERAVGGRAAAAAGGGSSGACVGPAVAWMDCGGGPGVQQSSSRPAGAGRARRRHPAARAGAQSCCRAARQCLQQLQDQQRLWGLVSGRGLRHR